MSMCSRSIEDAELSEGRIAASYEGEDLLRSEHVPLGPRSIEAIEDS